MPSGKLASKGVPVNASGSILINAAGRCYIRFNWTTNNTIVFW